MSLVMDATLFDTSVIKKTLINYGAFLFRFLALWTPRQRSADFPLFLERFEIFSISTKNFLWEIIRHLLLAFCLRYLP